MGFEMTNKITEVRNNVNLIILGVQTGSIVKGTVVGVL